MIKQRYACLCLVFLFIAGQVQAQVSVFAGPQYTGARYLVREKKQATSGKIGFAAGVGLLTQMEGPVYFSPMLSFSRKGYSVTLTEGAYPPDPAARNNDVTINTIELAPLFHVKLNGSPNHLFVRFGPSFDFNLSGRESFDSVSKRISRNMFFDFGAYSHATIAMNAHLGYQHQSGLSVTAYYSYGVSSLNNADSGPQIYHRIAGLWLGWQLRRRK